MLYLLNSLLIEESLATAILLIVLLLFTLYQFKYWQTFKQKQRLLVTSALLTEVLLLFTVVL